MGAQHPLSAFVDGSSDRFPRLCNPALLHSRRGLVVQTTVAVRHRTMSSLWLLSNRHYRPMSRMRLAASRLRLFRHQAQSLHRAWTLPPGKEVTYGTEALAQSFT